MSEAEQRLQAAISASSRESSWFDCQRSVIERELRNSADPAIDEFIARHCDLLLEGKSWFKSWTETVQTLDGTKYLDRGNSREVAARLAGIRLAIEKAEALKLVAIADVSADLAKIEVAIPFLDSVSQEEAVA